MAGRRIISALMLSQLARTLKAERAMRGPLQEAYGQYLDTVRAVLRAPEVDRPNLMQRIHEALRLRVSAVVRPGSIYQAQRGYNSTIAELRKLGQKVEDAALNDEERTRLLEHIDDIVTRKLDPLPDRVLRRVADLQRSGKPLRPYARMLANDLAKAASTYSRVHGERIANEEHGTGWWMWITVGDEKVRRTHRKANRERRRIGEMFSTHCRHPRDPLGPPEERENCRCHTKPCKPPRGQE